VDLKPFSDIIREFVDELSFTQTILATKVVGTNIELTVCSTKGVVKGSIIELSSSDVIVQGVKGNVITIKSSDYNSENELFIPTPYFLNGTLKAAEKELKQIKKRVTPLVYLFEVISESRNRDVSSSVGRSANVVMFFLEDDDRRTDKTTSEYYENYVNAMDSLCEGFIDLLQHSYKVDASFEGLDYTVISHTKAGFYDRLGHSKNLFSTPYSGVELQVTIPLTKNYCKC
jgi:hypothetical protein